MFLYLALPSVSWFLWQPQSVAPGILGTLSGRSAQRWPLCDGSDDTVVVTDGRTAPAPHQHHPKCLTRTESWNLPCIPTVQTDKGRQRRLDNLPDIIGSSGSRRRADFAALEASPPPARATCPRDCHLREAASLFWRLHHFPFQDRFQLIGSAP